MKTKLNSFIPRAITLELKQLLAKKKIVFLTGPRQVGKTFLSKNLFSNYKTEEIIYLNYDEASHRNILMNKSWSRNCKFLILDELHKMSSWKTWLKGLYDTMEDRPQILVTGSARMDTFKKGGDSLAGRCYHLRLAPFTIDEVSKGESKVLEKMMSTSSFPEPYLETDSVLVKLWRNNHIERIIKEDLLSLEKVRELKKIEILIQLLSERVGSTINHSNLARALEVSSVTIKHWLQILEDLYVIFKVPPYTKNVKKTLLKNCKYYFYDTGQLPDDKGKRLENITACHLLAHIWYLNDFKGEKAALYFIRDNSQREVDFAITVNLKLKYLLEVKSKNKKLANLKYFTKQLNPENSMQLVFHLDIEQTQDIIQVTDIANFLFSIKTKLV